MTNPTADIEREIEGMEKMCVSAFDPGSTYGARDMLQGQLRTNLWKHRADLLRLARIGARALRAQRYAMNHYYRESSEMEVEESGEWLSASYVLGEESGSADR